MLRLSMCLVDGQMKQEPPSPTPNKRGSQVVALPVLLIFGAFCYFADLCTKLTLLMRKSTCTAMAR